MSEPRDSHRPDVLLASPDLEDRRLLLAELQEAGYDVLSLPSLSYALQAMRLKTDLPRLILLMSKGWKSTATA